jgi:RNA polymerase sigma factor (sigma-70 family)
MATAATLLLPDTAMKSAERAGVSSTGRPPDAETSIELLKRARGGDDSARDALFSRYLPRLERWAHGKMPPWVREAGDTHDLVQNTLIRVLRNLDSFEPAHEGSFPAYVHVTLRNQVHDMIRAARRRPAPGPLDPSKSDAGPSPLQEAIAQETWDKYEAALHTLKPHDQALIVLRIEMGYSHKEVADELGMPSAAASSTAVGRALIRLAEEMRRDRR